MTKVDWSKAPEGSRWYANGNFYRGIDGDVWYFCSHTERWKLSSYAAAYCFTSFSDYEPRPQQWPSESRIDIISTNRNATEHYMYVTPNEKFFTSPSVYGTRKHYETQAELAAKQKQAKPQNKYDREIIGKYGSGKCIVDVYRVLVAFGDIPPEIQHALKKLLAGGKRGHKDEGMDYLEAIQSIEAYLNRLDDSSDQLKTV